MKIICQKEFSVLLPKNILYCFYFNLKIKLQRSKFASTIGKCRGISMFFSICLGKNKNAEAIKYLRISKKYIAKNEIHFCFKKKRNVPLIKKFIFVSLTIFKLDFIALIIYGIIHRCLYSLFMLFSFSYISF